MVFGTKSLTNAPSFFVFIIAISCEDPPTVTDADIFGGGFVFGAHVHYTCREGYQMQGQDGLTCGEKGKWIGETPVCKGMFHFMYLSYLLSFYLFNFIFIVV